MLLYQVTDKNTPTTNSFLNRETFFKTYIIPKIPVNKIESRPNCKQIIIKRTKAKTIHFLNPEAIYFDKAIK